jgi:hypothetical protein
MSLFILIFRFRRLKEQETLLDKYTSSDDTKNISLSETLYQELNQVHIYLHFFGHFLKKMNHQTEF